MRLIVVERGGIGRRAPRVIEAAMVLVQHDDGTVVAAAAEELDGGLVVTQANDPDFNRTLAQLGVPYMTVCDRIELPPPPPGARLVAGPGHGAPR